MSNMHPVALCCLCDACTQRKQACIDACEGLNPEDVKRKLDERDELLNACKQLYSWMRTCGGFKGPYEPGSTMQYAQDAIENAETPQ